MRLVKEEKCKFYFVPIQYPKGFSRLKIVFAPFLNYMFEGIENILVTCYQTAA